MIYDFLEKISFFSPREYAKAFYITAVDDGEECCKFCFTKKTSQLGAESTVKVSRGLLL